MIGARARSAAIEGALCAAVACPVYFLASRSELPTALTLSLWLAAAFALAPLILAIRALTQKNPAPEHRRQGLALRGKGCHACRWLRFWWPLALAPALLAAGLQTGLPALGALGLAASAAHLILGYRALAASQEPHWNAATGFYFEPSSPVA
ncbi:MAG: hypothetical protein AAF618_05260 [Pseudomonadota bacterium]